MQKITKVKSDDTIAAYLAEITKPRIANSLSTLNKRMRTTKRFLDIVVGLGAILILSPVLIATAIALKLSGTGSIFYCQTRVGYLEEPFKLFKFRTMVDSAESDDDEVDADRQTIMQELAEIALPNATTNIYRPRNHPRLTKIGEFLRRYSIDELPQLFNVLLGDMSLVGPRPALPWEVELFSPEQRMRHRVAPGLTGLWQVSGRNRLNTAQMLQLDLEYVECSSFLIDLYILLKTPRAVIWDKYTG
jgi:lipopolysaccharide/colanic/teichoic acid biosynthesis glycosyltransferase